MAQDDAIAIYFVILAAGHTGAGTEKRGLEQSLGVVTDRVQKTYQFFSQPNFTKQKFSPIARGHVLARAYAHTHTHTYAKKHTSR